MAMAFPDIKISIILHHFYVVDLAGIYTMHTIENMCGFILVCASECTYAV